MPPRLPPPPAIAPPPREQLLANASLEEVDRVARSPVASAFKAAARLQQSLWRAAGGHPMGTHPIAGGPNARALGSRLPLAYAQATLANFLDPLVAVAVRQRLATPQRSQTLQVDRLLADLLSSMPMCFNLFGTLGEPEHATRALRAWWPDLPGRVREVIFEWSPGRGDRLYLGNRSAFDVAFILELPGGGDGILGIETKYHEHPTPVPIRETSAARYTEVAQRSGLFPDEAIELLTTDVCSQLWLDHLLALSMLQHPSGKWRWARFVLVYADGNPLWSPLTARYQSLLTDSASFDSVSFDELMAIPALPPSLQERLVERYRCWDR